MTDWRFSFLGDGGAAQMRQYLRHRLTELERGQIRESKESLRNFGRFKRNYDWSGMPHDVLSEITRHVDAAANALKEPPLPEAAQKELRRAMELV